MGKYLALMKSQIKLTTAYVGWYWAGMFSTLLSVIVLYSFWKAVYAEQTTEPVWPLETMLTYVVIALLLNRYVAGVGIHLAEDIRDGTVAIELMRPYDILHKLLALDLGNKISDSIREAIPIFLVAVFFLHIHLPQDPEAAVLFMLSAVIGILIGLQLDFLVGITAFWLINIWGLKVLREAVYWFFTGAMIPLHMFPNWLQTLSMYMPFRSMVYVPISVYTGELKGMEAYSAIGIQLLWLVAVFGFIRLCWLFAVRRVTVFGG